MSRTAAKEKFRWAHVKPTLEAAGVTLLSAGIDEVRSLTSALIRAERFGSSLADTLVAHARELRSRALEDSRPHELGGLIHGRHRRLVCFHRTFPQMGKVALVPAGKPVGPGARRGGV